jgi:hypothetical protein
MPYTERGHASACDQYFGKQCNCAVGEIERLQCEMKEGHEKDDAFHKLAISERNQAYAEITTLKDRLEIARRGWYNDRNAALVKLNAIQAAEIKCIRRWYLTAGGKGSCMGAMPSMRELFELYPDLAPK